MTHLGKGRAAREGKAGQEPDRAGLELLSLRPIWGERVKGKEGAGDFERDFRSEERQQQKQERAGKRAQERRAQPPRTSRDSRERDWIVSSMDPQMYRANAALPSNQNGSFRQRTSSEDNLYLAVLRATEGKKGTDGGPDSLFWGS